MGNAELRVTQIYELDASSRAADDTSDADFSCALTGTTSETDFAISGLPRGLYGFAMVEATGDHPWLLSFLLRQDDGVWKLAGFYPRATDGGWPRRRLVLESRRGRMPRPMSFGWRGSSMDRRLSFCGPPISSPVRISIGYFLSGESSAT